MKRLPGPPTSSFRRLEVVGVGLWRRRRRNRGRILSNIVLFFFGRCYGCVLEERLEKDRGL